MDVSSGTGWSWDSTNEYMSVSGNGAVLQNLRINGNVNVTANDVMIKNCEIRTDGSGNWGISLRSVTNTTIQDCTIGGPDPLGGDHTGRPKQSLQFAAKDIYTDSVNTQILRCNIFDTANGLNFIQYTLIQDCYIHHMGYDPVTDHVDSFIHDGGGPGGMQLIHNTFFNEHNQTAAIAIYNQQFGPPVDILVQDNLIAGGGYSLYAGGDGPAAGRDMRFIGNHFSTQFYANGGFFGPVTKYNAGDPGNVWSGNVWHDGPNAGNAVTP